MPDGAKVTGSDKAKYQNRQFEIAGTVELIGKKFETNQQIRCGLINVPDKNLNGFVVDDNYIQIQDDSYERGKVVDKEIMSIEGVKASAQMSGNGLTINGANVFISLQGGDTNIFAKEGRMTVAGYNASTTGASFHTDYEDIFAAVTNVVLRNSGDVIIQLGDE